MKSLSWLLLGAAIGVTVAILYAPQPGKETRRMIKEKVVEIKDAAADVACKTKESADPIGKGEN